MKTLTNFLVLLMSSATLWAAGPEDSVVKISGTLRPPNPLRPWVKGSAIEISGTGVVIDGKRILTNAHLVLYAEELFVQSGDGGDKVEAQLVIAANDVDLALLTVKDDKFFADHPALPRAKSLPKLKTSVEVHGFPVGGSTRSVTKGTVSRVEFGALGLAIQVDAAINPGNSGGPGIVDGQMVGLVSAKLADADSIGFLIANEEIEWFLADVADGRYEGRPYQARLGLDSLENSALRDYLKLERAVKGVVVRLLGPPDPAFPLQDFDVLTRLGEHEIDNEGKIEIEKGARVSLAYLMPKLGMKGSIPVGFIRAGQKLTAELPVTREDQRLIRNLDGRAPSFFVCGPLVFSPVVHEAVPIYAQRPGLLYYGAMFRRLNDLARSPDEELVVVTAPFLPHRMTRGYPEPLGLTVREVNGVGIKNTRHLVETLRDSKDEFLKFRFAEPTTVLVFRRQEMLDATKRLMEDNGIARQGSEELMQVWQKKP